MKKNIIMLLAATLLVVAGCKKDDNKDNNANGEKMTFTSNLGGGAKTAITGKDMIWTDGDQIIINGETFDSEIFNEGKLAKFTGNVVEPVYQAFYPIGIYKGENNYELPATQTRDGNTLSGVNPMYARSTSTSLDFHNICALVKLDLTGTGIVTRIVAAADQPLSGAFSIAGDETNGYYAQLDSKDAAATVTLDCSNSVVQLNATTPTTFYMALPQGDFTNLTFTVENDKGMTAIAKQLALCPLQAGHLSNEVAQVAFVPAGALTGVFSVSATKKVHFSKGNLYYDGSALNFEANQYATPSSFDASHVSHFTWSDNIASAVSTSNSGNNLFCDENHKVSVDGGDAIYYALSKDEWTYLFSNHTKKWASVNGVNGYVIAPDDFSGELASSYADDAALAAAGNLVFLPAAGHRDGSNVYYVGDNGLYWSSTALDEYYAYNVFFKSNLVHPDDNDSRLFGFSVRLITESK